MCAIARTALLPFLAVVAAAMLFVPERAVSIDEKSLSFYHTHTEARLDVVYARGGEYLDEGLKEISGFLADFRTDDRRPMDPELLDFLYDLREAVGSGETYEVISAYRSPQTNEMLRQRSSSSGVATQSQHMVGKAIDVRLQGVALDKLRDTAIAMQRGGVGYYPDSNFIHLDTARVRRW